MYVFFTILGLGFAMVVISGLVAIYYNMIIAYTLYYFFASLASEVPWQKCKDDWKDKYGCVDRDDLCAGELTKMVFLAFTNFPMFRCI